MACTLIYYFLAPEGKYVELTTSSHPIEVEGPICNYKKLNRGINVKLQELKHNFEKV
jgi:hypothetical protein